MRRERASMPNTYVQFDHRFSRVAPPASSLVEHMIVVSSLESDSSGFDRRTNERHLLGTEQATPHDEAVAAIVRHVLGGERHGNRALLLRGLRCGAVDVAVESVGQTGAHVGT